MIEHTHTYIHHSIYLSYHRILFVDQLQYSTLSPDAESDTLAGCIQTLGKSLVEVLIHAIITIFLPLFSVPLKKEIYCISRPSANTWHIIKIQQVFANCMSDYNCESIFLFLVSVQFRHSVMSDSLQPHESQHARPPCLSPTPGVHSDSCPSSQ